MLQEDFAQDFKKKKKHQPKKMKRKEKNSPSSPRVFLLYILEQFRASHARPALTSSEPQAAPASSVLGMQEERPVCSTNAEAAIYSLVPDGEAHKTLASKSRFAGDCSAGARFPTSTRSCRSLGRHQSLQGTRRPGLRTQRGQPHSKAAPPQHYTKHAEGREEAK